MTVLRALIPSVILGTTLVAGGCNNKSEPGAITPDAAVSEPINLTSLSRKDFEKSLVVKSRSVKTSDAETALEKLHLASPSADKFTWGNKSGGNGQYSYRNLKATSQDGHQVSIGLLELTNVRMENDSPVFDKADMKNVNITAADSEVTIANLSLNDPSPEFSRSLMDAIESIDDMRNLRRLDLDLDLGVDGKAFGAILLDNIQITSQDSDASLNTLGWREDAKTGKVAFLMEAVEVTTRDEPDAPATVISIESFSGTGLDAKALRAMEKGKNLQKRSPLDFFSKYAPATADIAVKGILVQSSTMTAKSDGLISQSQRRGDTVTIRQALKPLTIAFSGQPKGKDAYKLWEGVKGAGYDDILISGSHTLEVNDAAQTFNVSQGNLTLKDGFALNYALSGQAADDGSAESMNVTTLDFNLTDQSIVNRAFTYFALQQGNTPQKTKMQAKGALMLGGAAAAFMAPTAEEQALITQTVNSLAGFIDHGGELQVSLRPETPLSLKDMKNMDRMTTSPKQFGLTIKHIK